MLMPTIVVLLNSLNTLKNGVGRGLLVLMEDWTTVANNQPVMVKDVHDDGSNDPRRGEFSMVYKAPSC